MTYEEAQDAVRATPDDAGLWFVLGTLAEEAGDTAQAMVAYHRALALTPSMQEALAAVARIREERVLAHTRDSLTNGGVEAAPPPVPLLESVLQSTQGRWLLIALLLLVLVVVVGLAFNFAGLAAPPVNPASGMPEADTPTATVLSASPTATLHPTSSATLPAATALPSATPTVVSAGALLERVAAAEAALTSGRFLATTRFSADTSSSAQVHFDLGRAGDVPRFHLITTYEAPESNQTTEYVIVGERAWQRVAGEAWVELAEREGVWGRIRRYLPHTEQVMDAEMQMDGAQAALHWQASNRESAVTLQVDVTTAIPLELREERTEGGTVTIVRYEAWNTPVEIEAPS